MNDMITIKNLTKTYGNRDVLSIDSLDLPNSGLVVLLGESGSGKTTLLNVIAGVDRNVSGDLFFNETNVNKLSETNARKFRINQTGYVFQNFNLLNLETVTQNIALPFNSISMMDYKYRRIRIYEVLELLGLYKLRKKTVNKLSGGEKQRTAIARALVNSPSVLLCDEPTGALDEQSSQTIFEILQSVSSDRLVIIASHDKTSIRYADIIINLKDGKIVSKEQRKPNKNIKSMHLFGGNFKRRKPLMPTMFKMSHSLRKIKERKYRSLITNTMLSLSLTGIGVSLLISTGISGKITDAFSSLINGNQIIMSNQQDYPSQFSNVYSASKEKVDLVVDKYQKDIAGVGAVYLVNFEDFFKTCNKVYVSSIGHKYYLDSFSTRSINDYVWLDGDFDSLSYPYQPTELEDDEIVIGLNYVDMVNLCFTLQIQRSYSALGQYLVNNPMTITLEIANSSWQYDDEQLFNVKAVAETEHSCFLHYNQLWNETVFEKMMLLPSVDNGHQSFPWEMYKLYYLKTNDNPTVFYEKTLTDESLFDFVFEKTNYHYHPLLCKINEICTVNRLLVFYVDKSAIDFFLLNKIQELEPQMSHYIPISEYGYATYASGMMSGFAKNTFVSLSLENLETTIDADSKLNDYGGSVALPNGVIQGNYLSGLSGGLRFSTRIDKLVEGRLPQKTNEIVISKKLEERLGEASSGKELYISSISNESINSNNNIEKEYSIGRARIVGVCDEDQPYIYQDKNWTISFFRDYLGISSFRLIPSAVLFELDSNVDASKICHRFNTLFRKVTFSSAALEISKSLDSTLKYANTILIVFSVLACLISILLLGTVVMLNVTESKNEITLFTYIGFSNSNINSSFVYHALIYGLIAFLGSSLELMVIDFIFSKVLSSYFNIGLSFSLNLVPILVVFIISITMSYLTSLVVVRILNKKKRTA